MLYQALDFAHISFAVVGFTTPPCGSQEIHDGLQNAGMCDLHVCRSSDGSCLTTSLVVVYGQCRAVVWLLLGRGD